MTKWINGFLVFLGGAGSLILLLSNYSNIKFAFQTVYDNLMGLEVERTEDNMQVVFFNDQREIKGRVQ